MTRITDEAVKAATRSLFDACWREGDWRWEQYPEDMKPMRREARAALEAALPHLEGATPAIDREAVREEIRAGLNSALCNGGFSETGWSPSAEVDRITNAVMALIGGAS